MAQATTTRLHEEDALAPVGGAFPFRRLREDTNQPGTRPFGLALARPVPPANSADPVLTYNPTAQVSMLGSVPAVESPHAAGLMRKKGNTVEDSQTFPDEVAG
jgi:hypothetical protein